GPSPRARRGPPRVRGSPGRRRGWGGQSWASEPRSVGPSAPEGSSGPVRGGSSRRVGGPQAHGSRRARALSRELRENDRLGYAWPLVMSMGRGTWMRTVARGALIAAVSGHAGAAAGPPASDAVLHRQWKGQWIACAGAPERA